MAVLTHSEKWPEPSYLVTSAARLPLQQHTGAGPVALNATAARMVEALQAVYRVSLNQYRIVEQLVMNISSQLYQLSGRPVSYEAQLHWLQQLQRLQLQNR